MGTKYFSKATFFNFFKRLTKNELPSENNKSLQIIDTSIQPTGWKYYYNQFQATMGKFVGGFDTKFKEMESKVSTTSGNSFRQAKRQILQLVTDSKARVCQLEKEFERLRNMLPYSESAKLKLSAGQRQSTFSVSMMEEGKIGEYKDGARVLGDGQSMPPSKELLSQYDRDTTLAHEPRFKGVMPTLKFPQNYSQRKSFMSAASSTAENRIDNGEMKVDSAITLQTSASDAPRI